MAKKQISRIKPIPIAVQEGHIKGRFEDFVLMRGRDRAETEWVGQLRPTPASPKYKVKIQYRIGKTPRVWVISPALKPGAPHTYSDGSLCLFTPSESPWREDKLIAETLLPWAAIWLYYYELWVDTDKWLGPETLHGPGPIPKKEEDRKGK